MAEFEALERTVLARRGRRLEDFTVAWNVLEGLIAVVAGAIAGSMRQVPGEANRDLSCETQ